MSKTIILHKAVTSSIVWLLIISCFAQICFAESVKVENVRFQLTGNRVVILYDFLPAETQSQVSTVQGGATKTSSSENASAGAYKVNVFLRKESDPHFSYAPTQVSGDIGIGNFVGKDRKIVWDIANEFPAGLPGKDYYFEVRAEPIVTKNSRSSWLLWIGAGTALLAGGAATYLIFSGNQQQKSGGTFPLPPGRPQ